MLAHKLSASASSLCAFSLWLGTNPSSVLEHFDGSYGISLATPGPSFHSTLFFSVNSMTPNDQLNIVTAAEGT